MANFRFEYSPDRKELRAYLATSQLTAAIVPDFKSAFESALKPDVTRVILDLSRVEFIDSSGVGALLSVQRRQTPHGEPVTLVGVHPAVSSVLALLRLQRVFKIE